MPSSFSSPYLESSVSTSASFSGLYRPYSSSISRRLALTTCCDSWAGAPCGCGGGGASSAGGGGGAAWSSCGGGGGMSWLLCAGEDSEPGPGSNTRTSGRDLSRSSVSTSSYAKVSTTTPLTLHSHNPLCRIECRADCDPGRTLSTSTR